MNDKKLLRAYCDESGQTACRYMVLGGVIVPDTNLSTLCRKISDWRQSNAMNSELKWTKVSNQKYEEYRRLIDLFFDHAKSPMRWAFKSVVFDMWAMDYGKFHNGDRELGFYKFMYQFLLHQFGKHAKTDEHRLMVYLDHRNTSYRLADLKGILNSGARKVHGRTVDVFKSIEPIDSKACDILQLADVLMGAIGSQWNEHHLKPDARRAKVDLANYIAARAGMKDLSRRTPYSRKDFEIWPFKLEQTRQRKAP